MRIISEYRLINEKKEVLSVLGCIMLLVIFLSVTGCASLSNQKDILAVIDEEPVTMSDLEYSLEIAHRVEDLSSANTFDISHYIHRIIDERLVIQEAGRMGLADYPDIQNKLQKYLVRESVVLLHDEEILKKVTIAEDEIKSIYAKDHEMFTIDVIEVATEEDASEILKELEGGAEFAEISEKHPSRISHKSEKDFAFKLKELGPAVRDTIAGLKVGDYTEAIKDRGTLIIIKLLERNPADNEKYSEAKGDIEFNLRKQKNKERENEYLAEIRDAADTNINEEILSAIKVDGDAEETNKWMHDSRLLVEVNGDSLKTSDFAVMLTPATMKRKKQILNAWIDRKVVDLEALNRHYELKSPLQSKLHRYRNRLLQDEFTNRVIVPKVRISDDEVIEYYTNHRSEYSKPVKMKLKQITLKSREDAEKVLKSLRAGASFNWLVKKKSTDEYASKGGVLDWMVKDSMKEPVRNVIDTLNPGDISEVIEVDSVFRIIKLQERGRQEFLSYEQVKSAVQKKVFKKKYDVIYSDYISTLKKAADIRINDSAIKAFEDIFKK